MHLFTLEKAKSAWLYHTHTDTYASCRGQREQIEGQQDTQQKATVPQHFGRMIYRWLYTQSLSGDTVHGVESLQKHWSKHALKALYMREIPPV